jgi:hypothetical protein
LGAWWRPRGDHSFGEALAFWSESESCKAPDGRMLLAGGFCVTDISGGRARRVMKRRAVRFTYCVRLRFDGCGS